MSALRLHSALPWGFGIEPMYHPDMREPRYGFYKPNIKCIFVQKLQLSQVSECITSLSSRSKAERTHLGNVFHMPQFIPESRALPLYKIKYFFKHVKFGYKCIIHSCWWLSKTEDSSSSPCSIVRLTKSHGLEKYSEWVSSINYVKVISIYPKTKSCLFQLNTAAHQRVTTGANTPYTLLTYSAAIAVTMVKPEGTGGDKHE